MVVQAVPVPAPKPIFAVQAAPTPPKIEAKTEAKRWEDGFNILPPTITDRKKEITEVNKSLTNKVSA